MKWIDEYFNNMGEAYYNSPYIKGIHIMHWAKSNPGSDMTFRNISREWSDYERSLDPTVIGVVGTNCGCADCCRLAKSYKKRWTYDDS